MEGGREGGREEMWICMSLLNPCRAASQHSTSLYPHCKTRYLIGEVPLQLRDALEPVGHRLLADQLNI